MLTPSSEDQPDFGYTLNEAFTPELREKMAKLEKENDIIKRRLESRSSVSEWEGLGGGERGTAETEELRCKLADSEITISHMEKSVKEKVERLSRAEVILKELSEYTCTLYDILLGLCGSLEFGLLILFCNKQQFQAHAKLASQPKNKN